MGKFNILFKKVYGEFLLPYGFIKLKGKYPYFGKLIGNEILLVVSYMNEWEQNPNKAFNIVGGITTVYRRGMSLDQSPRNSTGWWLSNNCDVYDRYHKYNFSSKEKARIMKFIYVKDDEKSMLEALQRSWEVTKEFLLPELLHVTDLKACAEYYWNYHFRIINIYFDEEFGDKQSDDPNEGLINLILYTPEEYLDIERKRLKEGIRYYAYRVDHAESIEQKKSYEKCIEEAEKKLDKPPRAVVFDRIYHDPVLYTKAMKELERRKTANLEVFRSYGLPI